MDTLAVVFLPWTELFKGWRKVWNLHLQEDFKDFSLLPFPLTPTIKENNNFSAQLGGGSFKIRYRLTPRLLRLRVMGLFEYFMKRRWSLQHWNYLGFGDIRVLGWWQWGLTGQGRDKWVYVQEIPFSIPQPLCGDSVPPNEVKIDLFSLFFFW